MPEWGNSNSNISPVLPETPPMSPVTGPVTPQAPRPFVSILSKTPPAIDSTPVAQRTDEVNTIQRILYSKQTSILTLTGELGAGKSVLAALFYRRTQLAAQSNRNAPRHLIWLTLSRHTTVPDIISAILHALDMQDEALTLFPPEQQLVLLLQLLRRPGESTLLVLDQIEQLFDPNTNHALPGRGATYQMLEMLQQDLGESRCLMTCYSSPYAIQQVQSDRVRSYLVTRITIPEGIALLQQSDLKGNPAELSLVWQRCAGHAYSLALFSTLTHITQYNLGYLLNAPEFQPLWSGEVTPHLIQAVFHYLNPIQRAIMRVLSLFTNPISLQGMVQTLTGENSPSQQLNYEHELDHLVSSSLVQIFQDEQGAVGYFLHDLLRYFVLEHYLDEGPPQGNQEAKFSVPTFSAPGSSGPQMERVQVALAAGHRQIAQYYLQLAREYYPPREQRQSLQDVDPLLAAIDHLCLAQSWQEACDCLFSEGLHESMLHWGAWQTLARLYTAMLPPQGVLNSRDQALVSSNLGLLYNRLGDYQQSQSYYEQAVSLQQGSNDMYTSAVILINQGELFRSRGEWQHAQTNFEQALKINNQLRDPRIESASLHNLGMLHQNARKYETALKCYVSSLHITQAQSEPATIGLILSSIGMLFHDQGHQTEALAVLIYAYQLRQSQQDPTISSLQLFINTLEQQMGEESFKQCYEAAMGMQAQILTRLLTPDVRQ